MCMAIYHPINHSITHNQCYQFSRFNKDGFGFAYINNSNTLIVFKSTNFDTFYYKYSQAIQEFSKSSPFIIHFRFGTSGLNNEANCHPFYINKDVCFIHNGIFRELSNDPILSDTNLFNTTILQPTISSSFLNTLNKLQLKDSYNKLVFLNSKKEYLIINESLGHWNNNIWYSSYSYSDT
jgi:predicted glutamine amidotransferase